MSKSNKKTRMFEFITDKWNPVIGCPHECRYCWARNQIAPRAGWTDFIHPWLSKTQEPKFKDGEFVFVGDVCDLFAENIPVAWLQRIFEHIRKFPNVKFLFLTKNPATYVNLFLIYGDTTHMNFSPIYGDIFPKNVVLGATIESNYNYPTLSKAPPQSKRLECMIELHEFISAPLFISIEPILDFNLSEFCTQLCKLQPEQGIAIGYDNYGHHLPEPPLDKTMQLIDCLEQKGIKIWQKTLREKWNA